MQDKHKEHIKQSAETIWEYMHMHHTLHKADVILVLGNRDTRVAEHAAHIFLNGWAPVILFSGSGSIHNDKPERKKFLGTTEAEIFSKIAIQMGVPKDKIITENKSQNTGENYKFSIKKLENNNIKLGTIIIVQKPYNERRAYATGKVWLPDTDLLLSSSSVSFTEYCSEQYSEDLIIQSMVGDLQRIIEYPKFGFQIKQDIPLGVMESFNFLVKRGYTDKMIKT